MKLSNLKHRKIESNLIYMTQAHTHTETNCKHFHNFVFREIIKPSNAVHNNAPVVTYIVSKLNVKM